MALDTRYRPVKYADVLGQDASVQVLRQLVKEGKGYHQSYVFCGQFGSGKTTMGRILARALLCSSPVDGEPCDSCDSCLTLLSGKPHECFTEMDAATKSTKEDMLRITEDIQYSSFSGKRRIYLFDESHRLSKSALDALLKPMEDCAVGSDDKLLVCIFCTTEPEKMQPTIFSRCAPAFTIKPVAPEGIAKRLAWVCDQEGWSYDFESLVTIADVTECHIRDALKTLEGVSVQGLIDHANVSSYLGIDTNDTVLDLISSIGTDTKAIASTIDKLTSVSSPTSIYERVAEASLCAYRVHLGLDKVPAQWSRDRILNLSERGAELLSICSRFSSPPRRPTSQTILLDAMAVHNGHVHGVVTESVRVVTQPVIQNPTVQIEKAHVSGNVPVNVPKTSATSVVQVDPRAVGGGASNRRGNTIPTAASSMDPGLFRDLVAYQLRRLTGGPPG